MKYTRISTPPAEGTNQVTGAHSRWKAAVDAKRADGLDIRSAMLAVEQDDPSLRAAMLRSYQ